MDRKEKIEQDVVEENEEGTSTPSASTPSTSTPSTSCLDARRLKALSRPYVTFRKEAARSFAGESCSLNYYSLYLYIYMNLNIY